MHSPLHALIGIRIDSIQIVLNDYLIFHFDRSLSLQVNYWFEVSISGSTFYKGDVEYEHQLCKCIGKSITGINITLNSISFTVDENIQLTLDFTAVQDYWDPEVLLLSGKDGPGIYLYMLMLDDFEIK